MMNKKTINALFSYFNNHEVKTFEIVKNSKTLYIEFHASAKIKVVQETIIDVAIIFNREVHVTFEADTLTAAIAWGAKQSFSEHATFRGKLSTQEDDPGKFPTFYRESYYKLYREMGSHIDANLIIATYDEDNDTMCISYDTSLITNVIKRSSEFIYQNTELLECVSPNILAQSYITHEFMYLKEEEPCVCG